MTSTTSEKFFDSIYRDNTDPWNFASSAYELDRYQHILRALGDRHFRLTYEPGCSVGVLTQQLAARSDVVHACDISSVAVQVARKRCDDLPSVHIRHATLHDFVPQGADLYIFSEVGYYLSRIELAQLWAAHVSALNPDATIVACHWLGHSADHLLQGGEVHEILGSLPGLTHEHSEHHPQFRLDRWTKREARP